MSPARPRYPTTRISTLTVNAKENQLDALGRRSPQFTVRSRTCHVARVFRNQTIRGFTKFSLNCITCNSSKPCLRWNTDQDTLIVSRGISPDLIGKTITKRLVLSTVSSVFDPFGLVAPFTIRARLLLKQLWKCTGQQWDKEIPEDSQSTFLEWRSELENTSKLAVPRAFFSKPNGLYELHVFGDGSAEAFSAVA